MTLDLKAIRTDAEASEKMGITCEVEPATIIALLDRLEAAEKDAARYRWLRDADMTTRCRAEHYALSALDVFMDAAMKEQK